MYATRVLTQTDALDKFKIPRPLRPTRYTCTTIYTYISFTLSTLSTYIYTYFTRFPVCVSLTRARGYGRPRFRSLATLSPLSRYSLSAGRARETAAHKLRAFTADPEIMGIRWVLSTRARQTRVTNCAPIDYRAPKTTYTYIRFSATIRVVSAATIAHRM